MLALIFNARFIIGGVVVVVLLALVWDYNRVRGKLVETEVQLGQANAQVNTEKTATRQAIAWHKRNEAILEAIEDGREADELVQEWGSTPIPESERNRMLIILQAE